MASYCSVLEKGSRLSAVRFARRYELTSVLKITSRFSEDDLYENLEWLTKKQAAIENKLFGSRHLQSATELFLYDVTSSYLEGDKNDFGEYGYNRDGRKGKKQIVIGLLCDSDGIPVSIEVFPGNTQDTKTFSSQVQKVATRFGCSKVVFVGDRGMIKIPQIQRLPIGFHYITAITRSQIQKLCNDGVIQPEFFEDSLFEIEDNGVRYILRRNPIRAEEIQKNRQARYEKIIALLDRKNHYLSDHPKAKVETAIRHIEDKIKKLKLDSCLHLSSAGREIILRRDEQAWQEQSVFDGCYMLKTDLSREDISKEDVHARYKDLSLVESAFRTCKQEHLEVRPVYVRKKASTRGHVFVVMLSYMIIQRLREAWKAFDLTVAEGLRHLSTICNVRVTVQNKADFMRVMKPDEQSKALLSALNVTLPHVLPANGINVDTKVKLKRKK